KTKQKGFLGGGQIKDENVSEDKDKLEGWYHNHGYRDMKVVDRQLLPGSEPRRLKLKITIDEGRSYRIGQVKWSGSKVVPTADLEKVWRPKPGDVYDLSRIDRAKGDAYGVYGEKGYLFVRIEPTETPRDSAVDVEFTVEEGDPSNIRYVVITGNKG